MTLKRWNPQQLSMQGSRLSVALTPTQIFGRGSKRETSPRPNFWSLFFCRLKSLWSEMTNGNILKGRNHSGKARDLIKVWIGNRNLTGMDRVCHLTKSWVPRRMKGRESKSKGESSVTDGLSHKLGIHWGLTRWWSKPLLSLCTLKILPHWNYVPSNNRSRAAILI